MKQIGKQGKKWLKCRREWLKANPPNFEGYYECAICHKWVPAAEVTLDHIIPRSNRPDLRYDFSNLQPACVICNNKKGSRHGQSSKVA